MNNIAFGQFYPVKSFVHLLDPRIKIILTTVYIVMAFLATTFMGYAFVAALLLCMILSARIPLTAVLKSVKGIIFLLLFTSVINVFFYREGEILVKWWVIIITREGLLFASQMTIRLLLLVMGTSLLTLTTTPMQLTDGLESLMRPLKIIKVPVHDLAITMSIALRFIPTLMEETDKIMKAQKARGTNFDEGGLIKRAKALLPILIPLFVSAFRRADELANALDARCYNATPNRTKLKQLKITYRDIIALFVVAAFLTVLILMKVGVIIFSFDL